MQRKRSTHGAWYVKDWRELPPANMDVDMADQQLQSWTIKQRRD